MSGAYYNENDPKAAAWLRELIKHGHIAVGVVDERSIEDVLPNDLREFTQCHFFAGIGGWSYALRLAGFPDDRPVWTGSCPCQPFSAAGKRAGITDERHLWPAWFHLIKQRQPSLVFGEQVASSLDWLDLIQTDFEAAHYAFAAVDICSPCVGSPHIRQRLHFVAHPDGWVPSPKRIQRSRQHGLQPKGCSAIALVHAEHRRPAIEEQEPKSRRPSYWSDCDWIPCTDGKSRPVESGTFPLAHGIPNRVGLLRGYGNAINPHLAGTFVKAYLDAVQA